MSGPDSVENKALEAANAISDQVGRLWLSAHAEGMRNGMEIAAQFVDTAASSAREEHPVVADLLAHIRDQLRLLSLQVPEPGESDAAVTS